MSKGYSIHLGVNKVKKPYPLFQYMLIDLTEQEKYALNLYNAFKKKGFNSKLLLASKEEDEKATIENFEKQIKNYQKILNHEDLLVITFCGHGAQWRDKSSQPDEKYDEYWAFADAPYSDDTLNQFLSEFDNHPRIVVIANCCKAGGMTDLEDENKKTTPLTTIKRNINRDENTNRVLWMLATDKDGLIPSIGDDFVSAIISNLNLPFTDYDAFFQEIASKIKNNSFSPNIQPQKNQPQKTNPKPDFRLEPPFLINI
jgi:Caspase domain